MMDMNRYGIYMEIEKSWKKPLDEWPHTDG
jgi:hypothetical protein